MRKPPIECEYVMRNIIELIRLTTSYFQGKKIETPRLDAELLLAHALGLSRIDLYLNYDRPINDDELRIFRHLVRRRAKREPVAYITGVKEFWSLDFAVNPRVLIPRPETELLVEQTLRVLDSVKRDPGFLISILELGTGCGAVAVALARSLSHRVIITATDISPMALAVARDNAMRHCVRDRVRLICGNLFDPIHPGLRFHFVISNPPYVPSAQIPALMPEVQRYEPVQALDGGLNGLAVIRNIIRDAPYWLMDGGCFLLEFGDEQQEPILNIIKETQAFEDPNFFQDLSGRARVVRAEVKRS